MQYPIVRKKIIRTVEIPVTRQIKVPIQVTDKLENNNNNNTGNTTAQSKEGVDGGKKKKELYHVATEQYTSYVTKPAVRQREIWVKKVVPEMYLQKVSGSIGM